jgi:hypothetical protein
VGPIPNWAAGGPVESLLPIRRIRPSANPAALAGRACFVDQTHPNFRAVTDLLPQELLLYVGQPAVVG